MLIISSLKSFIAYFKGMNRNILKLLVALLFVFFSGTLTNCAKTGCPANEALYKETMGESTKKAKKTKDKNKSGIIPPAGKKR